MLTVYTSNNSLGFCHVIATYEFPENGKDPWEQMTFVDEVVDYMHKMGDNHDASITTFSPYILNYLNLLLMRGDLNANELKVIECHFDAENYGDITEHDLMILSEGRQIVDTRILSDPISWIYEEYNKLKKP